MCPSSTSTTWYVDVEDGHIELSFCRGLFNENSYLSIYILYIYYNLNFKNINLPIIMYTWYKQ